MFSFYSSCIAHVFLHLNTVSFFIRLMLGLMLPTWFLSMWISNTAATSMMIPIIQAVVHTLEEVHQHACTSIRFIFDFLVFLILLLVLAASARFSFRKFAISYKKQVT